MKIKYMQIDEITLSDLEYYPIWEYLSEDDPNAIDECTIKGYSNFEEKLESMFIVKTKFELKDGTIFIGYVRPEKGLSNSQPVIIIDDNYIYFWNGIFVLTKEEKERYYQLLNKNTEEIFPIKWTALIETGGIDFGIIPGFGHIDVMDMDKELYAI